MVPKYIRDVNATFHCQRERRHSESCKLFGSKHRYILCVIIHGNFKSYEVVRKVNDLFVFSDGCFSTAWLKDIPLPNILQGIRFDLT